VTLEELLEAMRALIEAAGEEPMSEEDQARYEELEGKVEAIRKTAEIRARQHAYEMPQVMKRVATKGKEDTIDRAFDHYLRTGQINQDIIELRAQGEGVGSEGGFLVPSEFRQKLVDRMVAFGGFAPEAENITTSTGAPLEFPTLDDTSSEGEIIAEGVQFTGGEDLAFGTLNLGAYKYTSSGASSAPLRVSVELLQDANFDVAALVARKMGERIARAQAVHWATGTGASEPQGFAGSSITEDLDVDVHDVLDYGDLLDMETLLDPAYEQGAKWVMSKATWSVVRAILDGDNRPLIQANAQAGIGGGVEKTLLGYPVIIDQEMPDFPGAGNEHFIALGNWKEAYVIRRVANLTIVVNPYTRANFGQVEYVAWERADGIVQNRNAYVLMANTAS
jgi:HK97 family phage major capsid protein